MMITCTNLDPFVYWLSGMLPGLFVGLFCGMLVGAKSRGGHR
jgi:hypothetical protein